MLTNLVILSVSLVTNQQQAIIGESNGKALVASQETVIQRTITLEDVVLSSRVSTNAVGFAIPKQVPPPPTVSTNMVQTNAASLPNTNSPAFKRRLEREQRMKPQTNTPPQDDPRK